MAWGRCFGKREVCNVTKIGCNIRGDLIQFGPQFFLMHTAWIGNRQHAFKDKSFGLVKYLIISEKYYAQYLISFWCPSGNSHLNYFASLTPAFQCKWLFSRIVSGLFWSHCLSLSGKKWTIFQSTPMYGMCHAFFFFLTRDTSFSVVLWLFFCMWGELLPKPVFHWKWGHERFKLWTSCILRGHSKTQSTLVFAPILLFLH